jgi:hypothetical protein
MPNPNPAIAQSRANPGAIAIHRPIVFNEMYRRNCAIMAQLCSQTLAKRPDNTR